jgi:hypothetical protein
VANRNEGSPPSSASKSLLSGNLRGTFELRAAMRNFRAIARLKSDQRASCVGRWVLNEWDSVRFRAEYATERSRRLRSYE